MTAAPAYSRQDIRPVPPPATTGCPMPDTHEGTSAYRRQREAAAGLRERLTALGLPRERVNSIAPMSDMTGRPYIHVGTLPVDVIERLLEALAEPAAAPSARGPR